MRYLAILCAILIQCGFILGQDGSDMKYIESEKLDDSYIGRKLHLDFNQRSFAMFGSNRPLDKVIINVNGKKVQFIEHRVDDGYNSWFSQQYLESVEEIESLKLRITEFELLKVNKESIVVKGFFNFINKQKQVLQQKSFTQELSFKKKDITEFLFKAKN